MAEKTTVARPYAQAIFDLARKQGALGDWSTTLQLAVAVVADPQTQRLINHPRVRKEQIQSLILDVGSVGFSLQAQNFIKVLIENRRLNLLPEIAAQYELYRAEAERTITAEVVSAFPVSNEQQAKIVEMRFFGGMTNPEIADALELGERTVAREWQSARLWLYRELNR